MRTDDLYGVHVRQVHKESVLAATATGRFPLMEMPFAAAITSVRIQPNAAVTGNTTNHKNLNIQDGGADGTGTTEIGNLDLDTGVDLVALDSNAILTVANGTAIDAGDILVLEVEQVGSGVLIPASDYIVEFEAR